MSKRKRENEFEFEFDDDRSQNMVVLNIDNNGSSSNNNNVSEVVAVGSSNNKNYNNNNISKRVYSDETSISLSTQKRSKSEKTNNNESFSTTLVKNNNTTINSSHNLQLDRNKVKSDQEFVDILSRKYPFKINSPPKGKQIRIYCDGIFDLFHFGHAEALKQAKKVFSNVYLLVGVCDDQITHRKKGKTVMTDKERAVSLSHCRWVDEVIEHAPWVITQEFIDKHDIHYVAHDAEPYVSGDCMDVYGFIKEQGKFLPTQRTEGISTSDLITRIVKDYDKFIQRNLERGISPKELGLGYLKEKKINMKRSFSKIRTTIHHNWHETKVELSNDFSELAQTFIAMLNGDRVVDKILRLRKRRRTLNNESEASTEE